ncbi:MAG: four helix bundle protein [Planctomycetes bacterium]|nr:four helix bundle protein [Planctomycetota bacterium]
MSGDRGEEVKPGIQERSFAFAVRILKLTRALPRDVAAQIVARQIARCGTGVGSNVEEAQGAQTRKELAEDEHRPRRGAGSPVLVAADRRGRHLASRTARRSDSGVRRNRPHPGGDHQDDQRKRSWQLAVELSARAYRH